MYQDVFRRDSIYSYGFLWQEKLREMWLDPCNSVGSIGRCLGVDFNIVKQQASKLGLPARRTSGRGISPDAESNEDSLQFRNAWLQILEENQGETRDTLLLRDKRARVVYRWLKEHDNEWLLSLRQPKKRLHFTKAHLLVNVRPAQEAPNKSTKEERDKLTSEAIRALGERIMRAPGEPQRVTRAQIEKALPNAFWFLSRPHDFPLVVRAYHETIESREAFALRRIQWALEKYQEESLQPTRREFILRAKGRRVLDIPSVQAAIEEAFTKLAKDRKQQGDGWKAPSS